MQVSKWGNSLAVRLPAAVVQTLQLKEGDQIELYVHGERQFAVARDRGRLDAIEAIRKLARPLPQGFRFDRTEANER